MGEKTVGAGANGGDGDEPVHPLRRPEGERRSPVEQETFASLVGGFTERLLAGAGVGEGMRVLDVGCGDGDVSLLAASLVGPGGEVIGVDIDPGAVAGARERARELGLLNASFVEGDAGEADLPGGPFDAVVGRFVLLFQADPAGLLGRVAGRARPGGGVAFQEWTMAEGFPSYPRSPLWQRSGEIVLEVAGRIVRMEMGLGLRHVFVEAGLPAPDLTTERPVGGGRDYPGYPYMAGLIRGLLPMAERLGVATAEEVGIETLEERIREEVVELGGAVAIPSFTGAWATKPADRRD